MKLLLSIVLLFFAFSCATKESAKIEDLQAAIDQFNKAFSRGNTETLASMLASNYTHTNGSWKSFGKEQWMDYMVSRKAKIDAGKLLVDQYVMDELAIDHQANFAIVTARISTSGIEDNLPFHKKFRVTNIWVFENGKWLRTGFHDTEIIKKQTLSLNL